MEANQVDVVVAPMSGNAQQVIYVLEPRFTRQIVCDVSEGDWLDRIHDDVAIVHRIPTTDFDMRARPDANAASDSSASDSLAKAFGEDHFACAVRCQSRFCCTRAFASSRRAPARMPSIE